LELVTKSEERSYPIVMRTLFVEVF